MLSVIMGFNQKLRIRIPSSMDYVNSVMRDPRQAAYRLLPLASTPSSRQRIAKVWAVFKPNSTQFSLPNQFASRLAQLRRDGFVLAMPSIPAEQLQDILAYFKSQLCHDPYRSHLGRFAWNEIPSKDTNMGFYSVDQIVRAPHVMQLFNQSVVLELAEAYIGCKPTLDNIGSWWSYSGKNIAKGTQRYHRDFDSIGGFKIFFYLTDVDLENGPHEYVKGTHVSPLLDTAAAIPDERVWQTWSKEVQTHITGPAGTSFVADTFGVHRGQLPDRGVRLLLSAQYNINVSPHGPRKPVASIKELGLVNLDTYINRIYLSN